MGIQAAEDWRAYNRGLAGVETAEDRRDINQLKRGGTLISKGQAGFLGSRGHEGPQAAEDNYDIKHQRTGGTQAAEDK